MVRKGIEAVQAAAERGGAFTGGSRRYFKWNPGEEKVLRFLTDGEDICLTSLHEFIPCHDGSKRSFVCRAEYDEVCELCNSGDEKKAKKREIAYGVAIWRYPEGKKDGKVVFKTKTDEVEVDTDGKKTKETQPWVGIVQQAPRNFWSWFWSAYQAKGTLLDREYTVRRVGSGMDTDYQPFPEDPQELDLSKFEKFIPDLESMLEFLGSKEYYDKWLHGVSSSNGSSPSEATVSEDDLEVLRQANAEIAATAVSGEFD